MTEFMSNSFSSLDRIWAVTVCLRIGFHANHTEIRVKRQQRTLGSSQDAPVFWSALQRRTLPITSTK